MSARERCLRGAGWGVSIWTDVGGVRSAANHPEAVHQRTRLRGPASAGQLKASRTTIYTQSPVRREFMLAARLRPDARGGVEILEAFWPRTSLPATQPPSVHPLVHPLLIYADLVATGDSRSLSIAEQISEDHAAQNTKPAMQDDI
ncbi:type IV toxin-antitoxin system AbiEi family antitoxin [Paraburkholderia elongata]|uniref:type IV toxin-antitoxin system AbiEi family antitoxin n=1 Tax=Paraburkholderia elongata TaxID=2675747 RepID=UPI001555F32A|nr:type IV toxin-antitoxin system AbiEi family antitoxin [Paraburkholderia elongata]